MPLALKNWINREVATTLAAAVDSVATTLSVVSGASFPTSGTFRIQVDAGTVDAEQMDVTAGQGTNTWTVTRGVDGTTAAAHSTGAAVTGYTPLDRDGIRDLEYRLGLYRDQHADDTAAHGGGRELAYAERVSELGYSGTFTSDVWAAGTSGPAVQITFAAGTRPIWLRATALVSFSVSAEELELHITGGAGTGPASDVLVAADAIYPPNFTSAPIQRLDAEKRLGVLTNGQSYTYKLRHKATGGSGTIFGNSNNPIWLAAFES